MRKILLTIGIILILIFAGIGLFLSAGFVAVNLGLTNTPGIVDNDITNDANKPGATRYPAGTTFVWNTEPQWSTLTEAIRKDKLLIEQISTLTGVPPRLLITPLVVEQLRLFHSEREIYKDVFSPLKILGTQTQFSWGVYGFKEATAVRVEKNLRDTTSPYYLGTRYEHLLDFTSSDISEERFDRLTHSKDRYWAYLYAALYMKQIMNQWDKVGYPIADQPDIMATLFNIGFDHSNPNPNPQSGGAEIDIGDQKISFGRLGYEFYYSTELTDEFPIE